MPRKAFRVCLMLPEGPLTRWQAQVLRDVRETAGPGPILPPPAGSGTSGADNGLFALWSRCDRLLFSAQPDAFAPAPWPLADAPRPAGPLAATPDPSPLDGADLIVSLSGAPVPETLLRAAPLGALSLDFHDPRLGAHAQTAREFMAGEDFFALTLLWRRAGQAPRAALRSFSAVQPLYLFATANQAYLKACRFPGRFLARLLAGDPETLWRDCPEAGAPRDLSPPDATAVLAFLPRFLGRHLAAAADDLLRKRQWFLAMRRAPEASAPPEAFWDFSGFTPVYPPPDAGWADPFPFVHDGRAHVFFETIPMKTGRGAIAVAEIGPDGRLSTPRTVLETDSHLSYPFVFEHQGRMYMMPENNAARTLDLYLAEDYPRRWRLAQNLLSGVRVTDATLLERDGRFWLFANVSEPGASNWDELHLFFADSPLGPFKAHPKNPIVSDVRASRPAGRLFIRHDKLIRPAQDCSEGYGRRLRFFEVTRLSETDYAETQIAQAEPDVIPGNEKLHTFNEAAGWQFVDGHRHIWRW